MGGGEWELGGWEGGGEGHGRGDMGGMGRYIISKYTKAS